MDQMEMVFFTAHTTPLYSSAWTPRTIGQYAGTCIFLIVLSIIFRGLIAIRCNFQALLLRGVRHRDTSLLRTDDDDDKAAPQKPWCVNDAALRAVLDTILAGVSYLLYVDNFRLNLDVSLTPDGQNVSCNDNERRIFLIRAWRYVIRKLPSWRMGRTNCTLTRHDTEVGTDVVCHYELLWIDSWYYSL
jgi:solute carrier family 31 (copper transporter), member 1